MKTHALHEQFVGRHVLRGFTVRSIQSLDLYLACNIEECLRDDAVLNLEYIVQRVAEPLTPYNGAVN